MTRSTADAFTKWFLTGVGGLVALTLGNLGTNSKVLSSRGLSQCLLLLVVSVLFGVLSRYKAMQAKTDAAIAMTIAKEGLSIALEGLPPADTRTVFKLVSGSQPFISRLSARVRFFFARFASAAKSDAQLKLQTLGRAAGAVFMQRFYSALMVLSAVAFALDVAWWVSR